jgi:hypothetical protein
MVLNFINTLRNSFDGGDEVYLSGSCYHLYKILKTIFPNAECYFSNMHDHVITKIDNTFYDIKGVVKNIDGYIPLKEHKNYNHETLCSTVFSIYDLAEKRLKGIKEVMYISNPYSLAITRILKRAFLKL